MKASKIVKFFPAVLLITKKKTFTISALALAKHKIFVNLRVFLIALGSCKHKDKS